MEDEVFSLDLHDKNAQWRTLPLMPIPRSGTQAAVLDGEIFLFGGEKFGGVYNNAEMFDPVSGRWTELTPMPLGRHGTQAVTLGNMIFIPGGGPPNGGEAQARNSQNDSEPGSTNMDFGRLPDVNRGDARRA
jgi:N-acetylneuraminic acid mutarotase